MIKYKRYAERRYAHVEEDIQKNAENAPDTRDVADNDFPANEIAGADSISIFEQTDEATGDFEREGDRAAAVGDAVSEDDHNSDAGEMTNEAPSTGTTEEPSKNYENPEVAPFDKAENDEKSLRVNGIFDFVELFVFTVAIVMLVFSFVCRHSIVDGDSMQNTLYNGEHLIISDLFYSPKQGDIIVFEDRKTGFEKPMIKRVIALEGDTVEINTLGEVRVNGTLLDEEYVFIDAPYAHSEIYYKVPEGEVFVMGDHRNESSDSRYFGAIDEDTILGRVVFRFSPFNRLGFVK